MSAGHTPGPWNYDQTGDGKRICVGIGLVDGPNGYDVAEVYSDDCDSDEALANARLIAAAPELLAIAEILLDRGYVSKFIDEERDDHEQLVAAISKARGEA